MKPTNVTRSKFIPLMMLLVAIVAGAQVYKWVDEKGQVHFGDCPPADCETEELTMPEGPSKEETEAAEVKMRKTLEARKLRDQSEQEKQRETWSEEYADDLMEDERFTRCVETRYQLVVLERRGRAFKLDRNWTRHYIENADRPAEISRLQVLADRLCDDDPKSEKLQRKRILEIGKSLNIRCVAARENRQKSLEAKVDTDIRELQEAQKYVDLNCPDIELHNLWIADWIFVK